MVIALGCAAQCWLSAAVAAEPPSSPILRVETGRHTAAIQRIASDGQGRWLATASEDKTLRVWQMQSGKLLQTLRPPIDAGDEGKLYSVAMSPDGTYIAAAGWTGLDLDKTATIYIFQRTTGRLLRRIAGLPDAVISLAWSTDGRLLAAGLGGKNGIQVFRTDNYASVGKDTDYGSGVYGLDFSRDGRLAASSIDGATRLYRLAGGQLQRLAKMAAPGGKQPYGVRFSPDGATLAIGFGDTAVINLVSGKDLDPIGQPSSAGLVGRSLSSVAWSADGRILYAGGTVRAPGGSSYLIRAWSEGGRGTFRDFTAANGSVVDIQRLAGGGVVFAAGGPAWGVLDASGQRAQLVEQPTADFRGNWEGFRLSSDGLTVRFGFDLNGKYPVRFSLAGGKYEADSGDGLGLLPPRFSAEGIDVKDWKGTIRPTLNGAVLGLAANDVSRSLAVAPDGKSLVLGTEWWLRRFDSTGKELWQRPVPGSVWAINISSDGRLVVAAYGDGTIRWHQLSDGRELAAFFPHADRQRWVVWTPSGYYDASPGAEDLIGWHLNRGKDNAADFFPSSRFRSQFYRPDVIAKIFETLNENDALRLANLAAGRKTETQPVKLQQVLPPVVEIQSPADGVSLTASSVTIRYIARSPDDAPVTGLRARINGQVVNPSGERNLEVAAAKLTREVTLPIKAKDNEIQLFAENKNGFSTPAVLRLTWAGAKVAESEGTNFAPKLYVLAVGVSKYANPTYNLDLASKDASDFAAVLQKQQGQLYREVKIRLLTDEKATKDDVLDGLEWLKREVTSRDVGMMFLAGHGMNDNTGNYYFMPHNADPAKLLRTGVAQNDIKIALNTLAGKAVFFVDTCHSGNALGTAKTRAMGTDVNAFVNELASAENGIVVFTAATGRQYSLENSDWGNGAFTKAVVEGLSGKADFQKSGKITHKGLDYYVAERVKELTDGKQSPVSIAPSGITDFPIAVVAK
ncbi:MAG: caspase family protein [Sterolibacterium sp.]